ncbi:protein of unknown function DUF336 [Kalmanozyma brasiliensis GHG001]|uniref:Uncharacterized protein n=1 Tax=Kalmanozyma brasiliensis (strain GHG001) TaxID=1365824 RepID=V5EWL2_KALBG|nr:protein of unknown function DUF336 [Kalmanozyma brasiliensis GHG001]EST06704.1 protein of unknown function DUF336 [Kalmanozyma brasiliensis GHG001]
MASVGFIDLPLQEQIGLIEQHEATHRLSSLDNAVAFELGSLIRTFFLAKYDAAKEGIVISIALFSGHTLFSCAVGNPRKLGPDNWDWVRRKANTVRRFGLSSFLVGRTRLLKGKELDGLGPDYAAHGGGFPINVEGCSAGPVGAIVVSGLKQEDDHYLIVNALADFQKKDQI